MILSDPRHYLRGDFLWAVICGGHVFRGIISGYHKNKFIAYICQLVVNYFALAQGA